MIKDLSPTPWTLTETVTPAGKASLTITDAKRGLVYSQSWHGLIPAHRRANARLMCAAPALFKAARNGEFVAGALANLQNNRDADLYAASIRAALVEAGDE